ncbi:MAG: FtsX-like permease family protein [Peptostreptococcaceae bacterium]
MRTSINKDIVRDIIKTKGRFLSILFIVALGVAFFTGIKASPRVMKYTADKYYDDYNMMDIRVLSTLGLMDDDVDKIKELEGVNGVFPTYSIDVLTKHNSVEHVLKVHALDLDEINKKDKNYINQVKLIEGRLPQNSKECVLEKEKIEHLGIKIGEEIELESGTDKNLKDELKNTKYKVVGYIQTPYYLSHEKGSSSIGSGTVDGIVIIPQSNFKMDVYTELFLTVDNAKQMNSYDDEYFEKVDKVTKSIENISEERIDARYNQVVKEATEKLNESKEEFEDKKKEVNDELRKGQEEIYKYKAQIKDGDQKLKKEKKNAKDQIEDGKKQIKQAEIDLKQGQKEYKVALEEFNKNKPQALIAFKEAESKLNEANNQISNLKAEISNIEENLKSEELLDEDRKELEYKLSTSKYILNEAQKNYDEGTKNLNAKKNELEKSEELLSQTKNTIEGSKLKLEEEKTNLYNKEIEANKKFTKAEKELDKSKQEINKAQEELENSKKKANDEFIKAEKKIKDAEDEISKIENPEWHILDRKSHYSYMDYGGCANSIDALAKVFPVFFFLVAALVCLTTMTRMVDEQRINIGTLKALGYTTKAISRKYIVYALLATVLGALLGIAIGFTVFPIIIFNAYGIMYNLPKMSFIFDYKIALSITIISILVTTLAAYFACNKELKETPSILMRPKSPKEGKRILLERIPFIWNKMGFIGKVTIRNIFRYKKRFLMTVLGIAGSTALILTGFGIKDSIEIIVDGQYGSLFKYDMMVNIDKNSKNSDIQELKDKMNENKNISKYQFINSQNGKIAYDGKSKEISLITPSDINEFENFIYLRERKSQKQIKLNSDGIVLTEKIARELDIQVNDEIDIYNGNDKKEKAKVVGITENYISHYAYISDEYYKKIFGRNIDYNRVVGVLNDTEASAEESISKSLMENNIVKGVSFNTAIKNNFSDTIENLKYVVLIMIISAGSLAFVVLYNLTNVNISERIREIATIKVLGFYDKEVSSYIYRENIILTIIGTFVGLGLGKMLHQFIMITVEMESMMFGRVIDTNSYIWATIITIVLGVIVNLFMYNKLTNVQMVESLKSVD